MRMERDNPLLWLSHHAYEATNAVQRPAGVVAISLNTSGVSIQRKKMAEVLSVPTWRSTPKLRSSLVSLIVVRRPRGRTVKLAGAHSRRGRSGRPISSAEFTSRDRDLQSTLNSPPEVIRMIKSRLREHH